MTLQIKTYSPTSHKIKALIYGKPGSGKTSFGGTAPNVIFASAEAGLLSVGGKKIDYAEIKSKNDLLELYQYLAAGNHKYETVVIDSMTEINDIIKAEIEKKRGRALQLQDWSEVSKDIEKILRSFRGLPMHVIFIAHEKIEKDEEKVVGIYPALNGAAATKIAGFMDVVGYIYSTPTGEHLVDTLPSPKFVTKDRTGLIGNGMNPDFKTWIEAVSVLATLDHEDVVYQEEEKQPEPPKAPPPPKVEAKAPPKAPVKVPAKEPETVPVAAEIPVPEVPAVPEPVETQAQQPELQQPEEAKVPESTSEIKPLAPTAPASEEQIKLIFDLYEAYKQKNPEAPTLEEILSKYKIGGVPVANIEDMTKYLASHLIGKLKVAGSSAK